MNKFNFINCDRKNDILKRNIIQLCINEEDNSIAEISKQLNCSVPTVTKLINELIEDGLLVEKGKQDTNGGRRPIIYGLDQNAGFFVGVEIRRSHISMAFMQFNGSMYDYIEDIPFQLENTSDSLQNLCNIVSGQCQAMGIEGEKIIAYGFNLTGRVNTASGYSYSFYLGEDHPITDKLQDILGSPVFIENDSRAMTYAEYMSCYSNVRNMLFLNLTWGLGMGMIVNGQLVSGKSGFSGEIGHFPMLDNNQICQCGKIGCLETAASGFALQRIMIEKMDAGYPCILSKKHESGEIISLEDIIDAIHEEDMLAIESLEEVGTVLGRAIAGLINIFNPEQVVIGGTLSLAKEYLLIPVKGAINKYSLNLVNRDTQVSVSKLGKKAGPLGACLLSRSKILNLI